LPNSNRRWLLASRPIGAIKDSDFEWAEAPVPDPGAGEFLVRVTDLSFDPTQRGWLAADTYIPAVPIGDPVRADAVGQVVKSNHPDFKVGEMLRGGFGWQDFAVSSGETELGAVTRLPKGVSPEAALGVFGLTGLAAYFGLTDIGRPEPGDTVLVSGAAGATGSVAVQIAKALGCKVIAIAGSPEKRRWLVDVAGADACIDYKSENVSRRIGALAPEGVNVIFENVAGEILEAGLLHIALRARVVLCGAISAYNSENPSQVGLRRYMRLGLMRARMEGFNVFDYAPRFDEGIAALAQLIADGRLKTAQDVQVGLENCPATLRRLFEGKNLGKQLLKVAEPPLPVS